MKKVIKLRTNLSNSSGERNERDEKLQQKIKKEFHSLPMPAKSWEQRMFATIVSEAQEKQLNIALLWSRFWEVFESKPILAPAFSLLLLLGVYWVQPFSYWTPPAISSENALSYVEDITAVSYYEPTMEVITNAWIIEDY